MDSDSEIAEDFNKLVAMGRNRTRRLRSSESNAHYMDEPSFVVADGTPPQDEEWWVSSFIEESEEDSSPTVQASPEVCTLPSSQVVPGEAASFNQGNVASADSDSSSSSSSTIDFIPASAALQSLPDNAASTDSDSSTSSTSTIDFVAASFALPLVPEQPYGDGSDQMMPLLPEADSDDSDDSDFAPSPPASPNQSLNISDGSLSIYSDYATSPSVSFSQGALTTDDSDFAPLSPDSTNQSLSITAGPLSVYSDYAISPSVTFNQGAPTTDGSLSTCSDYATAPSVSFNQDDSYFASVAPVSPNQSLSTSDGSLSTYSDYATAPSVSFNQDGSLSTYSDYATAPSVSFNQDGSLSTYSDYATALSVSFNQGAPTAGGGPNADFTPLPMADLSFSPASTAAKQRDLIKRRNRRQLARKARRALNFASPIVNRASNILPALQATELLGQQPSVCAAPADDDFAACVDFNLPQVPVCAAPADDDFTPLPNVTYNLSPQVSDATALSMTDFAPLLNASRNHGGPTSLSVAVPNQRSAVSRRYSLSRIPRRYRRASNFFSSAAVSKDQQSASAVALPAVSLQPSRSALPPGAIPKRRSAVLQRCAVSHAPLQQRPRRGQRALNFAPPASRVPAIKPPDEIFPVERRDVVQAAISRNQLSDEEKSHLVIGEIAFQLDRRILSYIFVGQPRLYGFRVNDINERINDVAGSVLQRDEMLARNTAIMNTLSNYGYSPVIHSIFSEFIVNTFGIFKEKPCQEMLENYSNWNYLYKLIVELTPPALLHNMLVLLNSLWHLSMVDGQPLFIW